MSKKSQRKSAPQLESPHCLIDTHCHLDMSAYQEDLEDVLERAYSARIKKVVTIGIDVSSSRKAISFAKKYPMVEATAGIHPHDAGNSTKVDLEEIAELIEQHRQHIVGFGEIGLDYVKKYSAPETQKRLFKLQLAIADDLKLPVIIHDREAHDDMLHILKENAPFANGGIMHCFSGNLEYAMQIIDLGFYISIPGIVSFKKVKELKEVARKIPMNAILLETDGPFLAPTPYRGKRNEPAYLLYTASEVAKLRECSLAEIAKASTENACRLFNLDISRDDNG